jgi:hypothetical protein
VFHPISAAKSFAEGFSFNNSNLDSGGSGTGKNEIGFSSRSEL